jgi:predicted DNA-binding ribbon-helix-helix protein
LRSEGPAGPREALLGLPLFHARPRGYQLPKKYSLTIQGHATSLTLEPIFWQALNQAAVAEGKSLAALVADIDEARTTNLSSAVRVWLFERANAGPI